MRATLWGGMALLALLVLLTSLMSQQPGASLGGPAVRLMLHVPDPLAYALLGLFAASAVTMLVVLFPREVRFRKKKPDEFQQYEEPRKVSFGLIVSLYWGQWQPLHQVHRPLQAIPSTNLASPPRLTSTERPASDAPGYTWALFALATLVGLGVVGGGVWILFGDRIERWWYGIPMEDEARQALLEAVEISLDDLLREPDPRRAVIACYRRLEDVLHQHGLARAPWQTPLEYVRAALLRFHLPANRLQGLTLLFELAKFSAHPLEGSDKDLAIAALHAIKGALEQEGKRVPAT